MPSKHIADNPQFEAELSSAGPKLVVVDFTASWCGPCQRIAPFYEDLSNKFPLALFLKVDVDECPDTAASYNVTAMPTFIFFKNKSKVDKLQGADTTSLESKIKQHYGEAGGIDADTGLTGFIDLSTYISEKESECLNEDDDHPYSHCLTAGLGFLQSDCDEQLIMSISFNQAVKMHSIKIMAPKDKGPKHIRLFMNQPSTLDFDKADSMASAQDLVLTPDQLDGSSIALKFVKFQNVQNIQFFIKDNQSGGEVSHIDHFVMIGSPLPTTNMGDFKRVAGKKGETEK